MHVRHRGQENAKVEWRGGDKRLIEDCEQDTDLIRSILDVSKMHEFQKWTISGMREQDKVKCGSQRAVLEYTVRIRHIGFPYLPPIELFQVMDKMGVRLHSLAT